MSYEKSTYALRRMRMYLFVYPDSGLARSCVALQWADQG